MIQKADKDGNLQITADPSKSEPKKAESSKKTTKAKTSKKG